MRRQGCVPPFIHSFIHSFDAAVVVVVVLVVVVLVTMNLCTCMQASVCPVNLLVFHRRRVRERARQDRNQKNIGHRPSVLSVPTGHILCDNYRCPPVKDKRRMKPKMMTPPNFCPFCGNVQCVQPRN